MLASSARADLPRALRLIGEALQAQCACLVIAPADALPRPDPRTGVPAARPVPDALVGQVLVWQAAGDEAGWLERQRATTVALLEQLRTQPPGMPLTLCSEGSPASAALALPLHAEDGLFIGYLGLEGLAARADPASEHGRRLALFGDLLAGHLSRRAAEEALVQSEDRWRQLVDQLPEAVVVTYRDRILYANDACRHLLGAPPSLDLTERHFSDFLPAEQIDEVERQREAHVAAALRGAGRSALPHEHEVLRLSGEERTVLAVSASAPFHGVAAVQTMLRDVTESRRDEERYRAFFETISEGVWLVALDLPIVRLARPSMQADHILAHGRLADCNEATARLLGAASPQALCGTPIADLTWWLTRDVLVRFARAGFRLHNEEVAVRLGGALRHFAVNAAGRFDRGSLIGVWGSCTDVTARVEMERRMVAALEEQQERIGRDLHDSVGQLLTGVRMLSENLVQRHFAEGAPGRSTAARITAYAGEALERVRAICRGLAPPQLYQDGLAVALAELAAQLDALSDVRCTFSTDGRMDIREGEVSLQLYRIAQEAATNALRHANAQRIWINLNHDGDTLTLEIEDNGQGFRMEDAERSIGLYSMQRRASSIRAGFAIETQPGAGTTVRVTVPSPVTPTPERRDGVAARASA